MKTTDKKHVDKSRREKVLLAVLGGLSAFPAAAGVIFAVDASGIAESFREAVQNLAVGAIDGISGFLGDIGATIGDGLTQVIDAAIQIAVYPLQAILGVLNALFGSVTSTIEQIFSPNLTASDVTFGVVEVQSHVGETVVNIGGVELQGFVWGMIAIMIALVGVAIMTTFDFLPFGQDAIDTIGQSVIVIGAMIGAIGFFPDASGIVIGAGMIIIVLIAIFQLASGVFGIGQEQGN